MKKIFLTLMLSPFFAIPQAQAQIASASTVETVVIVRHGEKPKKDNGLLSCQGFNRALKLPQVLLSKFGIPNDIFAGSVSSPKGTTTHMRPFQTISPLATQLHMPLNLEYDLTDITGISHELLKSKYSQSTVFLAWEHKNIPLVARTLYTSANGNNATDIPDWNDDDFDSIWILKISKDSSANVTNVTFSQDTENLNDLSKECP